MTKMNYLNLKIEEIDDVINKLTISHTIEAVLVELEAVRTEAGRLGRVLSQLWCRNADVGTATVQGQAEVCTLRLTVRVIHVDNHWDLFLEKTIIDK